MRKQQALQGGRSYIGEGWAELMNLQNYRLVCVHLFSHRWLFQLGVNKTSPGMNQQDLSFLGIAVLDQCLFLLEGKTWYSCYCHPCSLEAYPLVHPMVPNHDKNSSQSSLVFQVTPACGTQRGQCCPPQLKEESSRQTYWENCAVGRTGQMTLGIVMSVTHGRKQVSR